MSQFRIAKLAHDIGKGVYKRIVVLCGAGISVAAGIPDFRGLNGVYKRYGAKLKRPEDLFSGPFYNQDPHPLTEFLKDMYEFDAKPTDTHEFIVKLHERGLLHHCYTQNIDGLERVAGVPDELLTECHGTATSISCSRCGVTSEITPKMFLSHVKKYGCPPICSQIVYPKEYSYDPVGFDGCKGRLKPAITFFDDKLPQRFFDTFDKIEDADLILVMGTEMIVAPFNMLPSNSEAPCYTINLHPISYQASSITFLEGKSDEVTAKLLPETIIDKISDLLQ